MSMQRGLRFLHYWPSAMVVALALMVAAPAHAYLYWGSHHRSIGRTASNGSKANRSFIRRSAAEAIAVNSRYIYWNNGEDIGRANINGSGVRRRFITGLTGGALAIDSAHLYWIDGSSAIGRANLDGTDVEPNFLSFRTHFTR